MDQICSTNSALGAPSWGELPSSAVIVKTVAAEILAVMKEHFNAPDVSFKTNCKVLLHIVVVSPIILCDNCSHGLPLFYCCVRIYKFHSMNCNLCKQEIQGCMIRRGQIIIVCNNVCVCVCVCVFLSTFLPLLLTYTLHHSFSLPGVRSGARPRIIYLRIIR